MTRTKVPPKKYRERANSRFRFERFGIFLRGTTRGPAGAVDSAAAPQAGGQTIRSGGEVAPEAVHEDLRNGEYQGCLGGADGVGRVWATVAVGPWAAALDEDVAGAEAVEALAGPPQPLQPPGADVLLSDGWTAVGRWREGMSGEGARGMVS